MPDDPLQELTAALRRLHRDAGEPSTREIGKRINFSHTTVAKAFKGQRCPSWPVIKAIVKHLNGDVKAFRLHWIAVRDIENPLPEVVTSGIKTEPITSPTVTPIAEAKKQTQVFRDQDTMGARLELREDPAPARRPPVPSLFAARARSNRPVANDLRRKIKPGEPDLGPSPDSALESGGRYDDAPGGSGLGGRSQRARLLLGIDLGTTNSVVAVLEGGEPTVIANAEGSRSTPSVVAFAGKGVILIGEAAKHPAWKSSGRTIHSVKWQLGTDWTFSVDGKNFTAHQISGFILQKLKKDAEAYFGASINSAVLTVPAWFSDEQQNATREAGQIAGLNVLHILNEPTAAALAYHLDREVGSIILVFSLGSATFDISVLEVSDGAVEVKAVSGDNHLGGHDWDRRIVDWLVTDFKNSYGVDLSMDKMALERLRKTAEETKIELSQTNESRINLPYISHSEQGPLHQDTTLTRAEFQWITSDLLDRCRGQFQKAIEDTGIRIDEIHHVVLAGGSTRMPAVADLVKSLTCGREPISGLEPEEVVAIGACRVAGVLLGEVN